MFNFIPPQPNAQTICVGELCNRYHKLNKKYLELIRELQITIKKKDEQMEGLKELVLKLKGKKKKVKIQNLPSFSFTLLERRSKQTRKRKRFTDMSRSTEGPTNKYKLKLRRKRKKSYKLRLIEKDEEESSSQASLDQSDDREFSFEPQPKNPPENLNPRKEWTGRKVNVKWDGPNEWYQGVISKVDEDSKTFTVAYPENETEEVDPKNVFFELLN